LAHVRGFHFLHHRSGSHEPALPALLQPMLDGSFVNRDQKMIKLIPLC